jgi:hypothetical protein
MRVKVDHEKANLASGTNYAEAQQKFGNPEQKTSKTATKGSNWMDYWEKQ